MSSSYEKHKSQVEAARKDDGKFGSYEADESGASLGGIVQAGETTDGYMGAPAWIGGKHEPGRDITEIAKDVRGDLKRAQREGWLREDLDFSVRTERFSGGRALRVNVKGMSDDERLSYKPEPFNRRFNPHGGYSAEASEIHDRVDSIVDQYNRDESNSQVDYFNTDFYHSIGFESEEDALADDTERDIRSLTKKAEKAGIQPGTTLPHELGEEWEQTRDQHEKRREDISRRKTRRQAAWRSEWAANEAGEGSAEHTSERLREKVLDADLPDGWKAYPKTGNLNEDGGFEAATVYASLDRPEDDTLIDAPRFQQIDITGPQREVGKSGMNTIYARTGIEATPAPDEGQGRVHMRAYTERAGDRKYTGDLVGADVDSADEAVNDMLSYLKKREEAGQL